FLMEGLPFHLTNPSPAMIENAALAFYLLRKTFPEIKIETLQKALAAVKTPGRMEIVQENPRVILSGDHNPAGIASLKETLGLLPKTKLYTVCAFSPDKPFKEMFNELKEISENIVLTQISKLRSKLPQDYFAVTEGFESDATVALKKIMANCSSKDTILI